MHAGTTMCGGQGTTCRGQFSPFNRWAVGTGARLLGLVASPSTCWASRCPFPWCCLRLANAAVFTQQLRTCAVSLISFFLGFLLGLFFWILPHSQHMTSECFYAFKLLYPNPPKSCLPCEKFLLAGHRSMPSGKDECWICISNVWICLLALPFTRSWLQLWQLIDDEQWVIHTSNSQKSWTLLYGL